MGQYLSDRMKRRALPEQVLRASPNLFRLFLTGERQHLLKLGSEIPRVFANQFLSINSVLGLSV
jgi:hypothetical protein